MLYVVVAGVLETHRRVSSSDFDFNENPLDLLAPDVRSLIERVVICQDQYEMPTEQEITKVLMLAVRIIIHAFCRWLLYIVVASALATIVC